MNYTDPCTIALEADKELMKIHEPYKIIHGRVYDTKEEYEQALHDFLNENWCPLLNKIFSPCWLLANN